MKTISLNGTWALSGKPEYLENAPKIKLCGEVPGCVQLDLSREGYLPADLFMGENICKTYDYEGYEWWYERSFTAPDERERVFLVFEGVDCVAEYFLNGVKFGESENMLIAHEFDVSRYLCDGENTLTVHIKSPVIYTHGFDVDAKTLSRKNKFIVYLKDSEKVVDALNIMEAPIALLEVETIKIDKQMSNKINRQMNCDQANINKTVNASRRMIEDINYIEEEVGLSYLPEKLQQIARIRVENPDASLQDIGDMMVPSLGKSGVNHRLRKLSEIAENLRAEEGSK